MKMFNVEKIFHKKGHRKGGIIILHVKDMYQTSFCGAKNIVQETVF